MADWETYGQALGQGDEPPSVADKDQGVSRDWLTGLFVPLTFAWSLPTLWWLAFMGAASYWSLSTTVLILAGLIPAALHVLFIVLMWRFAGRQPGQRIGWLEFGATVSTAMLSVLTLASLFRTVGVRPWLDVFYYDPAGGLALLFGVAACLVGTLSIVLQDRGDTFPALRGKLRRFAAGAIPGIAAVAVASAWVLATTPYSVQSPDNAAAEPGTVWEIDESERWFLVDGLDDVTGLAAFGTRQFALDGGRLVTFSQGGIADAQEVPGGQDLVEITGDLAVVAAQDVEGSVWAAGVECQSYEEWEALVKLEGPERIGRLSAASTGTVFAMADTGTVWGWGDAFGDTCTFSGHELPLLAGARDVFFDGYLIWAVMPDGVVYVWSGMLGDHPMPVPTKVSELGSVISLNFNWIGNMAVDADGHVWTWTGGLCDEYSGAYCVDSVEQVAGLSGIVELVKSNVGFRALDEDGQVWTQADSEADTVLSPVTGIGHLAPLGRHGVGGTPPSLQDLQPDPTAVYAEPEDTARRPVEVDPVPGMVQIDGESGFTEGVVVAADYVAAPTYYDPGEQVKILDATGRETTGTVVKVITSPDYLVLIKLPAGSGFPVVTAADLEVGEVLVGNGFNTTAWPSLATGEYHDGRPILDFAVGQWVINKDNEWVGWIDGLLPDNLASAIVWPAADFIATALDALEG
ncbi:MAG: hypothetical protein LBR58_11015 [Propionibacteriaceae bacterium]|jgi:hypothetical protein|nr:hypothetical protein [Propionibacteriaceae bacterium]